MYFSMSLYYVHIVLTFYVWYYKNAPLINKCFCNLWKVVFDDLYARFWEWHSYCVWFIGHNSFCTIFKTLWFILTNKCLINIIKLFYKCSFQMYIYVLDYYLLQVKTSEINSAPTGLGPMTPLLHSEIKSMNGWLADIKWLWVSYFINF